MPSTHLKVPFPQKDAAKSLGARWDDSVKRWSVPEGTDLAPFATWLPATVQGDSSRAIGAELSATELSTASKGIPLSRLLGGVADAVAQAYMAGVWTTAELLRANITRGHLFLELTERDANGVVIAKAEAVVWASNAARITKEFQQATGAKLGAGIKLMLRAKPTYAAQYGFKLVVDAIDPAYTLGDLEAKKREIRARLKQEGVFDKNRALPAPWDFRWVIVVAPERGAGLGDFAKEADRLGRHGVLQVVYAQSRFQGERAAAEIVAALRGALASWSERTPPDGVVIIRGGGAVNELAWLNDYELTRFICDCDIPVLTGIGHERDSTLLDEVAHEKFDTPSKVIAGIEQRVIKRSVEAKSSFDEVLSRAVRDADRMRASTERLDGEVKAAARATLTHGRSETERLMNTCRLDAVRSIHETGTAVAERFAEVKGSANAQLAFAQQAVPARLSEVRSLAFNAIDKARIALGVTLPGILERAALDVDHMDQAIDGVFDAVVERSGQTLAKAATASEALMREIAGQGPEKTLARGFAMLRSRDGKTLTSAIDARADDVIEVTFRDGIVGAKVVEIKRAVGTDVEGE